MWAILVARARVGLYVGRRVGRENTMRPLSLAALFVLMQERTDAWHLGQWLGWIVATMQANGQREPSKRGLERRWQYPSIHQDRSSCGRGGHGCLSSCFMKASEHSDRVGDAFVLIARGRDAFVCLVSLIVLRRRRGCTSKLKGVAAMSSRHGASCVSPCARTVVCMSALSTYGCVATVV